MFTLIAVPIVLIYFYWVTKKEMQKNFEEWLQLEQVPEEALISGKIIEVHEYKERFYYHRFNHVSMMKIAADGKEIVVKKITPLRKGTFPPEFHSGEKVHLYGNWKHDYFTVSRAVKQ